MGKKMSWKKGKYEQIRVFTLNLRNNTPLFENTRFCRLVLGYLRYYKRKSPFKLVGYVILPSYLHILAIFPPKSNPQKIIKEFKRESGIKILHILQSERKGKKILKKFRIFLPGRQKAVYTLWERRSPSINISDRKSLMDKLNVIHNVPVQEGLVDDVKKWKYSSIHNYQDSGHGLIEIDRVRMPGGRLNL